MAKAKRNAARHDPRLIKEAFELYKLALPNLEIARRIGVPIGTIARWSSRQKWKMKLIQDAAAASSTVTPQNAGIFGPVVARPEQRLELCQRADTSVNGLTLEEKQSRFEEAMGDQALRFARVIAEMPDASLVIAADKIKSLAAVARDSLKLNTERPATVINIGLLAKVATPGSEPARPALNLPSSSVLTIERHTGSEPCDDGGDATQASGVEADG